MEVFQTDTSYCVFLLFLNLHSGDIDYLLKMYNIFYLDKIFEMLFKL